MRRVHRNLSRTEVEALRARLTELVPARRSSIPQLLHMMRLITRKSQTEYARLCGVAPRVLAAVEAGTGSPTVETLEKLLRPFGYRVGVVTDSSTSGEPIDDVPRARKPKRRTEPAGESALRRALRKSRGDIERDG